MPFEIMPVTLQLQSQQLMEVLTQKEFNYLSLKDQVTVVNLLGKHLISKLDGNYRIKLFYFSRYYVEVWEDLTDNEILHVRTFENLRGLNPFLSEIDIRELVELINQKK